MIKRVLLLVLLIGVSVSADDRIKFTTTPGLGEEVVRMDAKTGEVSFPGEVWLLGLRGVNVPCPNATFTDSLWRGGDYIPACHKDYVPLTFASREEVVFFLNNGRDKPSESGTLTSSSLYYPQGAIRPDQVVGIWRARKVEVKVTVDTEEVVNKTTREVVTWK